MRKISTGDVFKMARLMKNANLMKNISDAYAEGHKEGAKKEEVGLNAFMDIMCSCCESKVENQLYDLIAGITEKTAKDIEGQSLESTIEDIKKICEENNIVNFIKSAWKLNQKFQG